MKESTVIGRSSGISWCDLGEEIVILRVRDNAYYRLGGTARDLWLRLDRPSTIASLVGEMRTSCDGDLARIGTETAEFLERCVELGLMSIDHGVG